MRGGQLLAPIQPAGAEQSRQQVQRGGQARAGKAECRRLFEGERQAPQRCDRMQAFDQLQRLFVCTEQDVLAVVERLAFEFDGACAAAQGPTGLEQRDGHAGFGQCQGCRAAGPAATHDRDTGSIQVSGHGNSQVLLASHSLRNGVSETRARRTGNPDCRISLSRVR